MGSPRYDEIVELVSQSSSGEGAAPAAEAPSGVEVDILLASSIILGGTATDRDAAIDEAGRLLVEAGAVEPSLRRLDARAGEVGVHVHGQRSGDPPRHQRGDPEWQSARHELGLPAFRFPESENLWKQTKGR